MTLSRPHFGLPRMHSVQPSAMPVAVPDTMDINKAAPISSCDV